MRGRHCRHHESTRPARHRPHCHKPTQHRRGHRHTAPHHPRQRHRSPTMTSHRLRQRTTNQRDPPVRTCMQGQQNQSQPIRRRTPPPPPHQQTRRRRTLLTPTRSEQPLQEPQQRRQVGLRQRQGCADVVAGLPQSFHPILDTGRQTVVAPQHTCRDGINVPENAEYFVVDGRLRHPEPTTQLPGRDLYPVRPELGLRHQHERGNAHDVFTIGDVPIVQQSADRVQQPKAHGASEL